MKRLGLLLLSITGAFPVLAQQPQSISVALCGATQRFCVDKNKPENTACIAIKIPAGTCPITKMEVDWDNDRRYDEDLKINLPTLTKDTTINVSHPYDLTTFIKSCEDEKLYFITVRSTFGTCNQKENLAPGIIIFSNPVTATIRAAPDTACADQRVNFTVTLCPPDGAEFTIDYGDGTSGKETFKTYTKLGNYTLTVTARNALCGVSPPVSKQLPIIGNPQPVMADSGGVRSDKDTLVVCLGGGNTVRFDGSKNSVNVTKVQWSISGPRNVTYLQKTNTQSDRPLVQFNGAGIYTVTMTGENPCKQKVPIKKIVRVIDLPRPTLPKQNDTCQAFTYRIANPVAGGIYKLNGVVFNPQQGVAVGANPTQFYVVELSVASNECAPTPALDTFYVRDTPPVRILGLQPENTFCARSSTSEIELTASQPDVKWTPTDRIRKANGKTFLDVARLGTFPLVAQLGSGTCAQSDTVTIKVFSATATAENALICRETKEVVLQRSPGPGVWAIANCGNCGLRGDTLSIGNGAPDLIRLTFTAVAGGTCQSPPAPVEVRISKPLASIQLPTAPYCEGKTLAIANNSTGATAFEWLIDNSIKISDRNLRYDFSAGTHTVRLRAIAGSCGNDTTLSVTISPLPVAPAFTASPAAVCDGATVTLATTGNALVGVSYRYNYGNGQSSDGFQPIPQRYANQTTATQTFTIMATARNGCGADSSRQSVQVKPRPTARLGVDSSTVSCPPASITFTNGSLAHKAAETFVDFGDGTAPVRQPEAIFKYRYDNRDTLIKNYRVVLTVRNECDVARDTVTITVLPSIVKARFSISNFKPCVGETITLRDASTPGVTKMEWSDGTGWQSVGRTASYTLKTAGPQRLYLKATGCGWDTTSRVVVGQVAKPGSFKLLSGPLCEGQAVQVENTTNFQEIKKFEWSDSAGTRDSSNFDFNKIYTQAGQYQLRLAVVSNEGCLATTAPQTVTVLSKPLADFGIVGDSVKCVGDAIVLKALTANASGYEWTFGGARVEAGEVLQMPASLVPAVYAVGLKVSNGVCSDSSFHPDAFTITECTLHIPDVFTPRNGDPINDYYTVFGKGISAIKTMRVYNRWGEQVFYKENFEANRPALGWDGGDHPPGQYVLEVEAEYLGGASRRKQRAAFYLVRKKL